MSFPVRRVLALLAAVVAAAGVSLAVAAPAVADPTTSFVSFDRFISDVGRMSYARQAAAGRVGVARDAAAFGEMRSYALSMYRGVVVRQSFVNEAGDYFDCVTVESQPGRRGVKEKMPAVPAPLTEPESADKGLSGNAIGARQDDQGVDKYGNAKRCPDGTIAMHRISMERLTGFATVKDFFTKGPNGTGRASTGSVGTNATPPTGSRGAKRYAHGQQSINNRGMGSTLSIWDLNTYFTTNQQWVAASYGVNNIVQTVESGTRDSYAIGNNVKATLFVYFTADGYNYSGCYNLDCPGFVQVSNNWTFGNGFMSYSVINGMPIELRMAWQFNSDGKWWLYLWRNGVGDPVGYYAGSLFGAGPMATGAATLVDAGGEVDWDHNFGFWPPMGSGNFSSMSGNPNTAYHRRIYYIPPTGPTQWTTLAPRQGSWCYPLAIHTATPTEISTSIYFGGPGATNPNTFC